MTLHQSKAFKWCTLPFCSFVMTYIAMVVVFVAESRAEVIDNKVAVFAALNKVTARISHLEIPLNTEKTFGALTIKPRACHTRPPTEAPSTNSFIEVRERKLDGSMNELFSGWIFAENPGIHAVEHPVYDVWLTSCKMPVAGKSKSIDENVRRRRTRVRSRRR